VCYRRDDDHTDVCDLEPEHRADAPRVRRVKTPHRFYDGFERLGIAP
jgi:phytanoyl-CoA hydroxylase